MFTACLWVRLSPETGGIRLAYLTNPFLNWHGDKILGLFRTEHQCFGLNPTLEIIAEALLVLVTGIEWAAAGVAFNLGLWGIATRRVERA